MSKKIEGTNYEMGAADSEGTVTIGTVGSLPANRLFMSPESAVAVGEALAAEGRRRIAERPRDHRVTVTFGLLIEEAVVRATSAAGAREIAERELRGNRAFIAVDGVLMKGGAR